MIVNVIVEMKNRIEIIEMMREIGIRRGMIGEEMRCKTETGIGNGKTEVGMVKETE